VDGGAYHGVADGALIGPNAILQLVSVLDRLEGSGLRARVMRAARVNVPPPDSGMIPEVQAAAVPRACCAWPGLPPPITSLPIASRPRHDC
jgi:divinyl protochlorophyllide a 8-vinyl-reductase